MNKKEYDFFISKTMFNLIALFGFLILFVTGIYFGYTFKENEEYINLYTKEIQLIKYINNKYTYNFISDSDKKYSEEIASRISNVVILFSIIGILFLEIGYRNSNKYKYNKSIKERLKQFIQKIKKVKE